MYYFHKIKQIKIKVKSQDYRRFILTIIILSTCLSMSWSQKPFIEFGKTNIAVNEPFTITIKIENGKVKSHDPFPSITNFKKHSIASVTSSNNKGNGQVTSIDAIIQNYYAEKEGTFVVRPFSIKVNDQIVESPGITVRVGAFDKNLGEPSKLTLEDFIDLEKNKEYVDIQEDAFLGLSTNKNQVYVGEGFTVTLAFYVAMTNRVILEFPANLGNQLGDILKQIRPSKSWEENFQIEEIAPVEVSFQGKKYLQHKLYQATFYPLNNEPVEFPRVGLKMIKHQSPKNIKDPTSLEARLYSKKVDKVFYTIPKRITVKELPPHPLRDQVPVGNFYLQEIVPKRKIQTGASFEYGFRVWGEGNISAIHAPQVADNDHFNFYPPSTSQSIQRAGQRVSGWKTFTFHSIPKEAGKYNLKNYFSWVFFNPNARRYDTLRARTDIEVSGESLRNMEISSANVGDFYDKVNEESNSLTHNDFRQKVRHISNVLMLLMLMGMVFLIYWSYKSKQSSNEERNRKANA